MDSTVSMQVAGRVARLTLNRPEIHNALDARLIAELTAALERCAHNDAVRVIVLAGAGKSFCAGVDLRHMQQTLAFTVEQNYADALALADLFHALRRTPQPVIARVHGVAYGGGVGLVAAADIACAHSGARFSLSETKLGIIPSIISPFCLERMGMTAYRRYALTAEVFDGAEAQRIGLISESVATLEELEAWVARITDTLLKNGPRALARAKLESQAVAGTPWDTLREHTARAIAELRVSEEGQEGLRAFLEKRAPRWTTE